MKWCFFSVSLFLVFCSFAQQTHTVKPKETLYSISRMYNIPVKELIKINGYNPENVSLKIGDVVKIAAPKTTPKTVVATPDMLQQKYNIHTVKKGETMYSISRMYPEISYDELLRINKLTSYDLQEGQVLNVVGKKVETTAVKTEKVITEEPKEVVKTVVEKTKVIAPKVEEKNTKQTEESVQEIDNTNTAVAGGKVVRGIGVFSSGISAAVYNASSVGKSVRIRNLMNNRTATITVSDKLSKSEIEDDVLIKIPESLAKQLNVQGSRFLVEVVGN